MIKVEQGLDCFPVAFGHACVSWQVILDKNPHIKTVVNKVCGGHDLNLG